MREQCRVSGEAEAFVRKTETLEAEIHPWPGRVLESSPDKARVFWRDDQGAAYPNGSISQHSEFEGTEDEAGITLAGTLCKTHCPTEQGAPQGAVLGVTPGQTDGWTHL